MPERLLQDEELGHGEKPDWVTMPGTVSYIRRDKDTGGAVVYPSCPNDFNGRACSKKLVENGGQW